MPHADRSASPETSVLRLFFGKLGFVHRRLWDRDGIYRIAVLLGPAPLVGCGVAVAIAFLVNSRPVSVVKLPAWGKPIQAADTWSTSGAPHTLEPTGPTPPVDAHGVLKGYELGWHATTRAVEVSPTYNTQIKPTPLTTLSVDGSTIDLTRIIAAGPRGAKFAGTGSGFLVVRAAGVYALSLRFERPAGPTADCLTRLIFGPRKIVSSYNVANAGNTSTTFDAARFDLKPGLYPIGWVFGCWQDGETVGPGRMTLLIGRPGDATLEPVAREDIVRAALPAEAASPAQRGQSSAPSAQAESMSASSRAAIDPTSGLERVLLGRTFEGTLRVNGFDVPLPPGQWALLADGSVTGNAHPENTGRIYFLGQIVHKRLVAALWVQAMRSPGVGFAPNNNCTQPANLYALALPDTPGREGCTWIRSFFSGGLQQWADKAAHLDSMARAVGENLAAKGVTYPQEFVTAGFDRADKSQELSAGYLFSPDKDGITSNLVPSARDSDWYKANLQRYPEKVAYVHKLAQWASGFAPKLDAAFEAGRQTAAAPK